MWKLVVCINGIFGQIKELKVLQCNSGGKGNDDVFEDIKYIGSPGWPTPLEQPFNCEWELTVNKYARGKFLKLSFIDFKTDCTKRNRLWVKEGGRTKFTKVCGKREIPDYISRLGRVTVGLDFGNDAQALISYQAVSPRDQSVIPDEIVQLKMASKSQDFVLNSFNEDEIKGQYPTQIPDYDYNSGWESPPPPKPRSNRGRIRYTERNPFPTRAVIKIAHPPPVKTMPPQSNFGLRKEREEKEALGMRNVLLTCIFGALGVIFLCGVIFMARKFLLQVERDKMAELDRQMSAKRAEESKLSEAQRRYESQSNKLQASYNDRKM